MTIAELVKREQWRDRIAAEILREIRLEAGVSDWQHGKNQVCKWLCRRCTDALRMISAAHRDNYEMRPAWKWLHSQAHRRIINW